MRLLVTGGTGFVMSNVLRTWLETHAESTAVCVDLAAPDQAAERHFAPVRERLEIVTGDIRDPDVFAGIKNPQSIDLVVHGAAMTPTAGTTEKTQAAMIVGVNVMGTVHCLEFARGLPNLRRMVHVSTGSVYGDDGPEDGPLPEEGFVRPFPSTLYPITKLSGELVARRYRELFDLPLHMVRLASVYGPMDRWTPGRDYACALNVMVHRAVTGETWTVSGAEGVGDWIHGGDVADAICGLLVTAMPRHEVYNIAHGSAVSLAELSDLVVDAVGGGDWQRVDDPEKADIRGNPQRLKGAWGAYDITRMRGDTGWKPRELRDAIADYAAWIREQEIR
jgi:UDP-glucose 4-epimerase